LVKPEKVGQVSAGWGWKKQGWSFQLEGYWKHFDRALLFLSSNDAFYTGGQENTNGWEERTAEGIGGSKGLEMTLEKNTSRMTASLAYTLSSSWRQFSVLNSGRPFPYRYDRLHDLKLHLRYRMAPWLEADALWVYATGNPITLAGVKFRHHTPLNSEERTVFYYTGINGYRLPAYHRLDVSLNAQCRTGRLQHQFQVGAYNAYNRQNPFFVYVDAASSVKGKAVQYSLLPVLPTLRYALKF
jgi:hypothetical protein